MRVGGEFALLRQALDLTGTGFILTDPRLEDDPIVYVNRAVPGDDGLRGGGGPGPQLPLPAGPRDRPGAGRRAAAGGPRAAAGDRRAAQPPARRQRVLERGPRLPRARRARRGRALRRRPGRRHGLPRPPGRGAPLGVPGRGQPAAGRLAGPALDAGLADAAERARSWATSASSTRSASTRSAGSPRPPPTRRSSGSCASSRAATRSTRRPGRARDRDRPRGDPDRRRAIFGPAATRAACGRTSRARRCSCR